MWVGIIQLQKLMYRASSSSGLKRERDPETPNAVDDEDLNEDDTGFFSPTANDDEDEGWAGFFSLDEEEEQAYQDEMNNFKGDKDYSSPFKRNGEYEDPFPQEAELEDYDLKNIHDQMIEEQRIAELDPDKMSNEEIKVSIELLPPLHQDFYKYLTGIINTTEKIAHSIVRVKQRKGKLALQEMFQVPSAAALLDATVSEGVEFTEWENMIEKLRARASREDRPPVSKGSILRKEYTVKHPTTPIAYLGGGGSSSTT
jgi:hypothetical protein